MNKDITAQSQGDTATQEAQMEILTQSTPTAEIRYRQGRGGRKFLYTDTAYVIRTLNLAFNWNWDFVVDNEDVFYVNERPFEVKCRGRLTVRMGEREITKTQFGCQPIEFLQDKDSPVSVGDAFKGAASDALKKCASLIGIALDLYDSDSDINTGKKPAAQTGTAHVEPSRATPANGGKKAPDPMTQYWAAVKDAKLSTSEGQRILSSVGGDAVKAIDALQGISQAQPA